MEKYEWIVFLNIIFTVVLFIYVYNSVNNQRLNKTYVTKDSDKEIEKLKKMREMRLTKPLAEKTRPSTINDIVGQERGLKALRAAICGPNPQHVIIYGPPGVGKTAAARVILEEAKNNSISPFKEEAKFVEVDATTIRFDERGIADPLIGSVHDPIYQGAGSMGSAGIPQPKLGAVTKANGGVLFLDEIGELHPTQINKLLKVLEDRKVFLESAYYNSEDPKMPAYIKDVFENGKILVIDEIERSLHPSLVEMIIKFFHNPKINKGNAQLIFNTHDTNLLSLDIFRRDQIWFAEKDPKKGDTDLYPLDDFSVRKNENIQKGYLNGRYGAIPFVATGDSLWED